MPNHSESSHQAVSVKSNLYWNTLIRIPSQILYFAISIIVARILMPRDYGILVIVMMLIGYANLFTNFGFNQAIVQKQIVDKKTLDSIFTFDLSISIVIAVGFFLTSDFIADFFRTPECASAVRISCLTFIITSFYGLPHAILRRDMNFRAVAWIDVVHSGLMSVVTLLLAVKGYGYWALVYGQLIPLFVITFVLCVKARWMPLIYFNNSLMKKIYDFGAWNFLRTQLAFVSQHVDKFIIGRWMGPVSMGFYDKSMSIAEAPSSSILININAVMFSSFSRNREAKGELQEHFKKSLTLTAFIIFPIYTGLIIVAPYFVHSLLGEKWSPMIFPFQIILFGFIFKSFGGLIASLNVGIGSYRSYTLRLLLSCIIFIIMCFILLRFKLNGIAVSFVIFCFIMFLLTMSLSISRIGISWMHVISSILSSLMAAVIMLLSVGAISYYYLTRYTIFNLVVLSAIGATIYFLCLIFDRTDAIRELRRIILCDIKKKLKIPFI